MLEIGPCDNPYQMGFLTGQRFSNKIRSRLSTDLVLQNQLLPFAKTPESQALIKALTINNQKKFPKYWDELLGTAEGSGVPVLYVMIIIQVYQSCIILAPNIQLVNNCSCMYADDINQLQKGDSSVSSKEYCSKFKCRHQPLQHAGWLFWCSCC